MTLKRWIVVGLVVAAVMAVTAAFLRPSTPLFSVRVVRLVPGETNAVLEITNNTGSRLNLVYGTLGNSQASGGKLNAHEASSLEFNATNATGWMRPERVR